MTSRDFDLAGSSRRADLDMLLDVGVVIFNPGIPETDEKAEELNIIPDVRRADARFKRGRLGHWPKVASLSRLEKNGESRAPLLPEI